MLGLALAASNVPYMYRPRSTWQALYDSQTTEGIPPPNELAQESDEVLDGYVRRIDAEELETAGWFARGDDARALDLAAAAAKRSGPVVPRANWIAGVSLFTQQRYADAALYFEPFSVSGLVAAVRRLDSDPGLRRALSENGRARALAPRARRSPASSSRPAGCRRVFGSWRA